MSQSLTQFYEFGEGKKLHSRKDRNSGCPVMAYWIERINDDGEDSCVEEKLPAWEKIALNWLGKGRAGLKELSRPSRCRSTENYVISSDRIKFEVRIYGAEGLFQIIKLSSQDTIELKKWSGIISLIRKSCNAAMGVEAKWCMYASKFFQIRWIEMFQNPAMCRSLHLI